MSTVSSRQHKESENELLSESNIAAQRAALEAIQVGRATLEQVAVQGEQLNHANRVADETQYTLDRSARILRGMTWSGWVQNLVSRDGTLAASPLMKEEQRSNNTNKLTTYENVPDDARSAVQAVQNYHANLTILEACETEEQKKTCVLVCNNMFEVANREVGHLMRNPDTRIAVVKHQLKKDMAFLRSRQDRISMAPGSSSCSSNRAVGIMKSLRSVRPSPSEESRPSEPLSPGASDATKTATSAPRAKNQAELAQESHLDALAGNLNELTTMAVSLNEMMGQQTKVMDSIDQKSETMHESSKMVTRRADRLIQGKSWTGRAKKEFKSYVTIQSLTSGKYLSANGSGYLILSDARRLSSVFGLWERKTSSNFVGMLHKATNKWAGQSYLTGSLACSSTSFGGREEWQLDGDSRESWSATRILLASGGWGQGGYLRLNSNGTGVQLGGSGVGGKDKAERWCIKEVAEEK